MKRYEKIVLEAEKGITLEVSEKAGGELLIRAVNIEKGSVQSESHEKPSTIKQGKHVGSGNYKKPPIPKGYKHFYGEWNNGFVIKRVSDESQFVWIPVGSLDANGTLDGKNFSEKFGRRDYRNQAFSDSVYFEESSEELALQCESVKKYGGFYISRYAISQNEDTRKPQSVRGEMPWVNIEFGDAKRVAAMFEKSANVSSHLPFGAEFDSILEWFIKSETISIKEVKTDSTELGNYWNVKDSPETIVKTGIEEEWCINEIYDIAGNVDELTQESCTDSGVTIRGGCYADKGYEAPMATRRGINTNNADSKIGFRVVLYIK